MAKRPVSRSSKPKRELQQVDPKRTLAIEEFDQLKAWALATINEPAPRSPLVVRNAAIVLVMLGTGARRFELCAFRCGNFYTVDGEPRVRFDEAKGNVKAEIPISNETWQSVRQWLHHKMTLGESHDAKAPLFCGQNQEHLSRAQLNNIWNATIQLAGLKKRDGVSCHASRHAAGMMLLRATKSLSQTARFLRHASERVTERFYKHVLPSDLKDGLDKAGL